MEIDYYEAENRFKEMLDEVYPEYTIGNMTWMPSDIVAISEVDFRTMLYDYADSEGWELV